MGASKNPKRTKADGDAGSPLQKRPADQPAPAMEGQFHVMKEGVVCLTDRRGHANPTSMSPLDLVLNAPQGAIPLWANDVTLRWRFQEWSFNYFANPAAAMTEVATMFAEAVAAWGTSAPVKFHYDADVWDFEIVMQGTDRCNGAGACALANAFFPDGGRHPLNLYPFLLTQTRQEMVETLVHELGHVFGLRHFFAHQEIGWPYELFGTHNPFTIMNYNEWSVLTPTDLSDLQLLYQTAWSGALTHINGTPIRFVRPYSASVVPLQNVAPAVRPTSAPSGPFTPAPSIAAAVQPQPVPPQRMNASYLKKKS